MMIIFAKPTTYKSGDADWYMPITNLSVNFDNFSGLLSSHTPQQLYQMSFNNGLHIDYDQWQGLGVDAGKQIPLTGGFLIIRPGKDLTLQTGQASGLQGSYTFQFNATITTSNIPYASGSDIGATGYNNKDINLWVITVNSGFFESIKGSSRIIKNVVSEADVINAPLSNITTRAEANRHVGGVSLKKVMNTAVSAVKNYAPAIRGAVERGMEVAPKVINAVKGITKRLM
jgi:hypothetical protein